MSSNAIVRTAAVPLMTAFMEVLNHWAMEEDISLSDKDVIRRVDETYVMSTLVMEPTITPQVQLHEDQGTKKARIFFTEPYAAHLIELTLDELAALHTSQVTSTSRTTLVDAVCDIIAARESVSAH